MHLINYLFWRLFVIRHSFHKNKASTNAIDLSLLEVCEFIWKLDFIHDSWLFLDLFKQVANSMSISSRHEAMEFPKGENKC